MAEEKNYEINFYAGADYGLNPEYGANFLPGVSMAYRIPTGTFGVTTDVRSANKLEEVRSKVNTGAKTIEISAISPEVWESVPEPHLQEIYRLKKLTGVELTLHGPIIEPTGARQGWNESHREQAERQMWQALQRAHKLEPKEGNIIVTFHSSAALPDPITKVKNEQGQEQVKDFWIVDEYNGRFENMQFRPDYFKSTEGEYPTAEKQVEALTNLIQGQNKEIWFRQLQGMSFHANNGITVIDSVLKGLKIKDEKLREEFQRDPEKYLKVYEDYMKGKVTPKIVESAGPAKKLAEELFSHLTHGDLYLRDAYQNLQTLFNQAYGVAKRNNRVEDLQRLDAYRKELKDKIKDIEKPSKLLEFGEEIIKGINVLRSIEPPQAFRPLRDFAIDKSSKTFSNIAFNAYKEFKEKAPIIAIENPPAGSGLTRAEDLRELIKQSREKLVKKLVEEKHLSESNANEIAKKLIGATWDVGHINMMRKYGYSKEDIIKETQKIAPLVKHVHLSDNFGMEHTELPMGAGNVPVKPMLEAITKYNEKVKKIIEAGNWYQHFKTSPFKETLRAFGSPVYAMKLAPYWNQAAYTAGSYFAGYGQMLPEQHFSIYGAGFSNMPPELGGQMGGRARMGGAPIE